MEIRVGGGTSIMPRVAPTLYDFVELDNGDFLKVSEAVFRIFDRQEWLRVNRARARIKVLIDKIGIDAFREMVEEELKGDWVAERDFSIDHLMFYEDEEANAPGVPAQVASPNGDRSEFDRFVESNVAPQRQEGFSTVADQGHARRPHPGAVPRPRARSCASTPGGYARTTVHQNFVLRWVRDESIYDVWHAPRRARPRRRRRRTRSPTSSPAPAPTPASSGITALDGPEQGDSGPASSRWRSPTR